jgi:hypothetical protein
VGISEDMLFRIASSFVTDLQGDGTLLDPVIIDVEVVPPSAPVQSWALLVHAFATRPD